MDSSPGLSRRGVLGGTAALGAVGLSEALAAEPAAASPSVDRSRRREFVVRSAYVMSMDPAIGDIRGGDVHVRDGVIVAVGPDLRARGFVIDGRGAIVMPGLVDTHWHMWTTLYRSLASSSAANAYFTLNLRNGAALRPQDTYRGVRLALADAIASGITTVHDWSHNLRAPAYADANLRAHAQSGLRGRFSYGTPQGAPANQTINLADLRRVHDEWFRAGRAGLMHLGLAGRPPGVATDAVFRTEYDTARALNLPVSYHANSNRQQGALAMIQALGNAGALGPQTQIIHALFTTPAERDLLASSGASVSSSPWSELLIGYGVPPIRQLLDAGVLFNLSVDTVPLTGTADMFSIIRVALALHRGESESEFSVPARRMIQAATIDGASGLGLGDVTGSLTPGKRADLILVRTDDVHIAPFTDPANMIATAAGAEHVDTVVVDGRILKRHGRLTTIDAQQVVREAQQALAALLQRAG
jgi:cytosine/adenosine deaminase-related metal-dependent hydrolase